MLKIEINENKKINLCDDSIQIFLSLISNKKKKLPFLQLIMKRQLSLKIKLSYSTLLLKC